MFYLEEHASCDVHAGLSGRKGISFGRRWTKRANTHARNSFVNLLDLSLVGDVDIGEKVSDVSLFSKCMILSVQLETSESEKKMYL